MDIYLDIYMDKNMKELQSRQESINARISEIAKIYDPMNDSPNGVLNEELEQLDDELFDIENKIRSLNGQPIFGRVKALKFEKMEDPRIEMPVYHASMRAECTMVEDVQKRIYAVDEYGQPGKLKGGKKLGQ